MAVNLSRPQCVQCILQTQLEIEKALAEDPSVYEYDAVYDQMQETKKQGLSKLSTKDSKVRRQVDRDYFNFGKQY